MIKSIIHFQDKKPNWKRVYAKLAFDHFFWHLIIFNWHLIISFYFKSRILFFFNKYPFYFNSVIFTEYLLCSVSEKRLLGWLDFFKKVLKEGKYFKKFFLIFKELNILEIITNSLPSRQHFHYDHGPYVT